MGNCQCNHKNDDLNEILKDETTTPKINNEPIEKSENLNNEIYNKKIDYNNINDKNVNTKEDFNYVDDNKDNQKSDQLKNSNDNIIENNNNNSGNRTNDIDYKDKMNPRINHDDNSNNNNNNSNDNENNNDNYNNNNQNDNNNTDNENESQNNENKNIFDPNLTPNDEFSKFIFENINKIRTDPKSYISKIRESENNITKDKKDRLIYKSNVKVALTKGLESFEEAIDLLNKTESMNKLFFDPNLTIPLPETEDEIKDKNYLKEKVQELIKKRSVKSYWRDIVKEKETSFLLSIVDDTGEKSGMKRKNILNPIIKYIGINSILIGKTFACYILLSDKDK